MNIKPQIAFLNLIIEYCKANDTDTWIIKHIKSDIKHIKFLAENDSDRLEECNSYSLFSAFLNKEIDFYGAIASLCLSY